MDVHDYARILRRNFVLIIAITLIGLSAGATYALLTPASYAATTQLFVASAARQDPTSKDLQQGTEYARQAVNSYVDVVTSALVLVPVIEDLGLSESVDELAGRISASTSVNTVVITITARDERPDAAARLAAAVGESFTATVADQLERATEDQESPVRIETIQPASVPVTPTGPGIGASIAIGALIGLAVGVVIAAVRSLLDSRVHGVDDVDKLIEVPIVGGIALDPSVKTQPLIVAFSPTHPAAEAFRALRTNVQFLAEGRSNQAIVITSANPSEGKSTTAANLALAFSESGQRTVLVDGDLRRPRLAKLFDLEGAAGLSDALVSRVAVTDVLQQWGGGNLFVLPAGSTPPNPAELLGSPAMDALILQLRAAFDVVLIDAPPILAVTDAAVLGRALDGVLMVAAAGSTTRSQLQAAVANVRTGGARVVGAVVTMLPTAGADKTSYGVYAYTAAPRR